MECGSKNVMLKYLVRISAPPNCTHTAEFTNLRKSPGILQEMREGFINCKLGSLINGEEEVAEYKTKRYAFITHKHIQRVRGKKKNENMLITF